MSNEDHRKYQFAKRKFDDARSVLNEVLKGGHSARRLERYWGEFLNCFASAQKALRDLFIAQGAISDEQKLVSLYKTDERLIYAHHSRNSETHVAEVVKGVATLTSVKAGGHVISIMIGETENITFVGNTFVDENGISHPMPNFSGALTPGGLRGYASKPGDVIVRAPYLKLLPALDSGKTYPVPDLKCEEADEYIVLAQYCMEYLANFEARARAILGLNKRT